MKHPIEMKNLAKMVENSTAFGQAIKEFIDGYSKMDPKVRNNNATTLTITDKGMKISSDGAKEEIPAKIKIEFTPLSEE